MNFLVDFYTLGKCRLCKLYKTNVRTRVKDIPIIFDDNGGMTFLKILIKILVIMKLRSNDSLLLS